MKIPKLLTAAALSFIGFALALPAQAVLTIDSATWDGKKLVVSGTDGRGDDVAVFYTDYDDTTGAPLIGDPLGIASVKGNGSWKLQINSNRNNPLVPVPCAVSATLAGDPTFENFPVAGAPGDCAPPPPGNNPPVCTIDTPAGDVTITTGDSVDYTGTVVDPDTGDTVTIAWAFEGGTPANSNAEEPGTVMYSAAGIFTTTLDATDNNGASCVQQTRTITVEDQPGNNPPVCTIDNPAGDETITIGGSVDYTGTVVDPDTGDTVTIAWAFEGGTPLSSNAEDPGLVAYNTAGTFTTTLDATDNNDASCVQQTRTITVGDQPGNNPPTAVDQTFPIDTAVLDRAGPDGILGNAEVPSPGVLLNATDLDGDDLTARVISGPAGGTLVLDEVTGAFTYDPNPGTTADSFTYVANDGQADSNVATVALTVQTNLQVNTDTQNKFNIMMNYELGMHCTGFEFAYCCVLPPYNSIIAQVARSDKGANESDFPMLLEGDPNENLDALGRETVLREPQLADVGPDGNGDTNFNKYVLKYWHDAQPRNDGRGKPQSSTLISGVEGNSLFMWNTIYDAADVDAGNVLQTSTATADYNGSVGVVVGDGDYTDVNDNYGSGWMNHFYIYSGLEGDNPNNSSAEADKIRLGLENLAVAPDGSASLVVPTDCGPALHPMGPDTQNGDPANQPGDNTCAGVASKGNLLTYSTDQGTVVYTQMKVLENLPVMLTSPRIWEALGLPLTPFEDTIDFFGDPGLVDEDSVRPYVAMKAQMHHYDPVATNGIGAAVIEDGNPVIGFGTAPIDIPNCERCHSELTGQNSAQNDVRNPEVAALVQQEMDYWNGFYGIVPVSQGGTDSDWYSRLKGAAISILAIHDAQHGTSFTANYPAGTGADVPPGNENPLGLPAEKLAFPQNTRLGHESVICQKCHADNVIAVVKSASCGPLNENGTDPCLNGSLIPPITEAIHDNHRNVTEIDNDGNQGPIIFADSQGRDGGCQGCHPAHRSDGDMAGYPITEDGSNFYANLDNRDANGGCFVGRDVHSNPNKDNDGAETALHLNPVGQWLSNNVFNDGNSVNGGIWCTNCHQQLGQELWKAENVPSLVHSQPGDPGNVRQPVAGVENGGTLLDVANALGISEEQAIAWLDPNSLDLWGTGLVDADGNPLDTTHTIWDADPGLCNYVAGYFGVIPVDPAHDGNVATVEVNVTSATACSTGGGTGLIDCGAEYPGAPAFHICGSTDVDGDFSVSLLDFCTTPDCVAAAQATLPADSVAVPVPFSAATDGRDHWLSAGEPHCADCHAAPYTEQSGNINAFPPFNYPRKASLMRYSRGHQDITCQGCHESIHGLYPVTPTIDTTSYAQAANLNADGSHGPVKCGSCHAVNNNGVPTWIRGNGGVQWPDPDGTPASITNDLDAATSWAHTYTDEQSVLTTTCLNCHGVQGNNWSDVAVDNESYMEHASSGNNKDLPRSMMDKAEIELTGAVFGTTDGSDGACQGCHGNEVEDPDNNGVVNCTEEWKLHLTEGRVAESTWETASVAQTGGTCGW